MIDLNKAGAWDAKEQLEIAELLRNPSKEMYAVGIEHAQRMDDDYHTAYGMVICIWSDMVKAMIDAATGGEG